MKKTKKKRGEKGSLIKLTSVLVPDVGIRPKAEQDEHHLRVARIRARSVCQSSRKKEKEEEERRRKEEEEGGRKLVVIGGREQDFDVKL